MSFTCNIFEASHHVVNQIVSSVNRSTGVVFSQPFNTVLAFLGFLQVYNLATLDEAILECYLLLFAFFAFRKEMQYSLPLPTV